MATTHRAPKQWCLTKTETVNSFENWKQNLIYTLSLDQNFSPYLSNDFTWQKKARTAPLRGFINDAETIPEAQRKTAYQKVTALELMLGQIANYCPVIARNSIVKNSTCINDIWQQIRLHYGFQSTGAHFLDFSDITLEADEKPEDLFQRLSAFVEDNLLQHGSQIEHHGIPTTEDEELTPTLENFIVLSWLRLINQDLPRFVKQRYGTELRSRTLASIKPEISQALDSLLIEIQTSDNARAFRTQTNQIKRYPQRHPRQQWPQKQPPIKVCLLCQQASRKDQHHFLSTCPYLPEQDKKFILKARQITNILELEDNESEDPTPYDFTIANACTFTDEQENTIRRIQVRQSPSLNVFYQHHVAILTIDSGATGNMMKHSTALRFGINITKSTQSARQADGTSPLKVIGEIKITFTIDGMELLFDGLVVENLDVEILAGTPFMESNDISVRPAKHQVIIGDNAVYTYCPNQDTNHKHQIRRAHILRAPNQRITIWPGEFVEVEIPDHLQSETALALEPRSSDPNVPESWPEPDVISSVSGKIRIPNNTSNPVTLKKQQHFCQIQTTFVTDAEGMLNCNDNYPTSPTSLLCHKTSIEPYSNLVQIDPDNILQPSDISRIKQLLYNYDEVFEKSLKGYNGASGPFKAVVNMGPVQPPQRKGRVPQYSRNKLQELSLDLRILELLSNT